MQNLNSVFFINNSTGYIAGTGGLILKTITGGLTNLNSASENIPSSFKLYQNYPNPFNPGTKIKYDLRVTGYVKLKVYDVLGNEVAVLVNEKQNAGSYEAEFPNHASGDEISISGGIYFYKLTYGNFSETKRMIYLK